MLILMNVYTYRRHCYFFFFLLSSASYCISGELSRALHRHRLRRVEDDRVGHRAKQGDIFEAHLRWPVVADRDADMRALQKEKM